MKAPRLPRQLTRLSDSLYARISGIAPPICCRQIANYVSSDSMLDALNSTAAGKKHKRQKSFYDRCIAVSARGTPAADKVKVAHWLAEKKKLTLEPLDLEKQIMRLAEFIRTSNHQFSA